MQRVRSNDTPSARASRLLARLTTCDLCPRKCLVDRTKDECGVCNMGRNLKVASYSLHFGEEPPISGQRGSGTIFLSGCNLKCIYCQNYDISQYGEGVEVTEKQFVSMMLHLQERGAHNINFVTPTHFSAQILACIELARAAGLTVPIVYNSSGYDSVDVLREFEGLIDIYMPDMRYWSAEQSACYSDADDYPDVNRAAIAEMHRQVGDLQLDDDGVAQKGLLIRHLVLPENIAGSDDILNFIAEKISKNTYLSLMSQYHPSYRAHDDKKLGRHITAEEYRSALEAASRYGLNNCRFQDVA